MDKTERLYAVAEELRRAGRSGTTGPRLARLFEVSERTIKRDVSALQQAGLPVWAQAGPGGGYVLDASATLPPVNFTPQQAVALSIALAVLPPGSPFSVDAAAAQGKIWDALGPQARERASALAGRVWVDRGTGRGGTRDGLRGSGSGSGSESGWGLGAVTHSTTSTTPAPPSGSLPALPSVPPDVAASDVAPTDLAPPDLARPPTAAATAASSSSLRAVEQSLARHRVLALRYRDSQCAATTRHVEPVLLAHTEQAWYVIAWCRTREAVRWFRLDRVERADLTAESYQPRPVSEVGEPPSGARPVG